jgi:hypothetical protein
MPSIRDFSGGVVNQELLGKDNGAGIIIDANNVLSSWNGELRKRTGSRIIAQLEKKSRIIPYRLPNNDDALLVFTDKNIKGYEITDAGLVVLPTNTAIQLYFPNRDWSNNSNGDWRLTSTMDTRDFINEPFRIFNYKAGNTYTYFGTYAKEGCSIGLQNVNTPYVLKQWSLSFFVDVSKERFYYNSPILQYSDNGSSWSNAQTATKITYADTSSIKVTTLEIANVEKELKIHKYWRVAFFGASGLDGGFMYSNNVSVSSSADGIFDLVTRFTESDLDSIKYTQTGANMFFACDKRVPFYVKNETGLFESGDFIPKQTTDVWNEDKNGTPSCVAAFQNRLVFSGFEKHKNRVILSEFGNFNNFTAKTTDVKSTDPISADSVELRAPIENLWAGNNALYALSSDGVSMIDAQGGVIATDQISFKLRNREPADGMTPTTKDDIMIYLGNDRRKIFITDYDFIVQRFKAKDLSIGYNGFLTSRIVALHYASRKCSLIYGYKDDGNMLALLFDVDLQKNALFPCDIGGDIKDMQVFKSGDKFRVLMVAQIDDRWYLIEKNEQPEYTVMDFMSESNKREYSKVVVQDGLYLDYMTRRYYNEPVDFIENLPYGLGENVAVFADGKYIGEKICSAGGPYAWAKDNKLIYTLNSRPVEGDAIYDSENNVIENQTVCSSTLNNLTINRPKKLYAWSDAVDDRHTFTETETPKVGDDAYYGGIGKVKVIEVGKIEHPEFGLVDYVKIDATTLILYRDSASDTDSNPIGGYKTEEYARSSINDKATGPIGIRLDAPAKDFVLGYNYDAYAVLKLATPYTSKKYPKEVATYLINTGYLEIGNSFDNLQPILNNMRDKLDLFDKPMLLNGEYTKTMDKLDNSPYIILRSNEPMPFMITGIDFKVDYSNYQGGI